MRHGIGVQMKAIHFESVFSARRHFLHSGHNYLFWNRLVRERNTVSARRKIEDNQASLIPKLFSRPTT